MGSQSNNIDKGKQIADECNKKSPDDDDNKNEIVFNCSICQETLLNKDENRTTVTLRCGHKFHLDCIGSAFNAKGTMQCPNCRTIEPGQWHIPVDHPTPVFNPVGWMAGEFVIPLGFGVELCPFGSMDHLNLSRGPILCPYFDYSLTIAQYLALSTVTVIPNLNSYSPFSSGVIVHNPYGLQVDHRTNPFWLTPLSPLPTNPRYFRSVNNPEVIISRHYFTHPSFDYRFYSSVNNALVVPPNLSHISNVNTSVVPPHLGGTLETNALVVPSNLGDMSAINASVAPPNLDGISTGNASMVPPHLGSISTGGIFADNASVVSTYLGDSSNATVPMAPLDQVTNSLANTHMDLPYVGRSSADNVLVVLPSRGESDGDNISDNENG